jgi:glycerol uptake facilitator-like aquaporin
MPHANSAWFFKETVLKIDPDWAYACFLLNVLLPGTGTMISAAMAKEKCRCDTVLVGIGQLLTCPLLLFGWIWSINHGGALMDVAGIKDKNSIESSMTQGQTIKYALARLLYECFGTYILTLMFISAPENSFPLFLTFWITTAFAIRVSGAHFNPAISFAFSLRKDTGSISRKLAVWYMAFQCFGALAAGFTCLWILGGVPIAAPTGTIDTTFPFTASPYGNWFRSMY